MSTLNDSTCAHCKGSLPRPENLIVEEVQTLDEARVQNQSHGSNLPRDGGLWPLSEPSPRDGEDGLSGRRKNSDAAATRTSDGDPLVSAYPPDSKKSATIQGAPKAAEGLQQALTKYRRIVKLQHRFFTSQTELQTKRDTVKYMWHDLDESLHDLLQVSDEISTYAVQHHLSSALARLKAVSAKFTEDQRELAVQMQLILDKEQALSIFEYKLAKAQPELLQIIGELVELNNNLVSRTSTTSSSQSRRSSSFLNPLENQYYNKRGHVRLLQDQLMDYESGDRSVQDDAIGTPTANVQTSGYSDSSDQNTMLRERGYNRREYSLRELHDAEGQLRQLWEQCQAEGLDVGDLDQAPAATPDETEHVRELRPEENLTFDLRLPSFLPLGNDGLLPRFLRRFRCSEHKIKTQSLTAQREQSSEQRESIENWVENVVSTTRSNPDLSYLARISDDVAPARGFVLVHAGGEVAPNGEAFMTGRFRKLRRLWWSDESLHPSFRRQTDITMHFGPP